ncbi:MAG: VWA domain-containing protein [Hyphomicrobium sp.]
MTKAPRLFAAAIALLAILPPARAADAPATMLVIDGSGSMWGRLEPDRRAKIDHVRDLLAAKLAAAPATRVGVTSYGHRRRGDCSDAQTIAGLAAPREAAVDAIAKLDPRGKGPLVAGLAAAFADVGATRPASLIVITDGADNCQQDACAAAAGFAASAPGVPIHMITVGVDPADAPRLACVAKATGGGVFEANDPPSLAAAIDAAAKVAMLTPDAVTAPTSDAAAATTTGPATLKATLALADGANPIAFPAHWRIFQAGATTLLAESAGAELTARLDPGSYDVEAEAGRMRTRKTVAIESGAQQTVALALDAARLTIKVANAKGAAASPTATLAISPDGETKDADSHAAVAHRGSADLILPPGAYKVSVADGMVMATDKIVLEVGEAKSLDLVLDAGRLELDATGADGAPLADVAYTISDDDPESADGRRNVARSRAPRADFTLPAGTYYIEAASGAAIMRDRVAVGAGETVKRTLSMPLVPVKISAQIAGAPATAGQGLVYRVAALDGDQREVVRALSPVVETALLPGRYRIAAHLDAHHINAERDVVVEAGKPAAFVIDIATAEIQFKAPPGAGDSYWEITNADGKPVWRTQVGEPKALLAPGRYNVRFEQRDRRLQADFSVKAGERKTLELGNDP